MPEADQDEREERSDVRQVDHLVERLNARGDAHHRRRSGSSSRAACRSVGCTFAKNWGSRPSRAIAKKMRGCPSWKTSSTAVWATTDPKATTPTIQFGMCDVLHRQRQRLGLLGDAVSGQEPGTGSCP